jgi:hypothetical protein
MLFAVSHKHSYGTNAAFKVSLTVTLMFSKRLAPSHPCTLAGRSAGADDPRTDLILEAIRCVVITEPGQLNCPT